MKVFTKGLDQFHFAKLTTDSVGSILYDVPVSLKDAQKVDVKPTVNTADVSGDNTTEYYDETSGAEISIQKTSLAATESALLLGERTTSGGLTVSGEAPYGAFGYRRIFSNGVERLTWILKTKFKPADESISTQESKSLNPQYDTISGSSVRRIADNEWKCYKDSAVGGFTQTEIDTFFSKATLETMLNVANPTYGEPAVVELVTTLPATGISGVIYVLDGATEVTTHYWDGTAFIENTPA